MTKGRQDPEFTASILLGLAEADVTGKGMDVQR